MLSGNQSPQAEAVVSRLESPFSIAAHQPAAESSESQESYSPKSESTPTSTSDYGSNVPGMAEAGHFLNTLVKSSFKASSAFKEEAIHFTNTPKLCIAATAPQVSMLNVYMEKIRRVLLSSNSSAWIWEQQPGIVQKWEEARGRL